MQANELKRIRTTKQNLINRKKELDKLIHANSERLKELRSEVKELDNQITNLSRKESGTDIVITEHALIRFFERVCMLPVREKEQELKDKIRPFVNFNRTGKFPIYDKYRAVVRDGVVITIEE